MSYRGRAGQSYRVERRPAPPQPAGGKRGGPPASLRTSLLPGQFRPVSQAELRESLRIVERNRILAKLITGQPRLTVSTNETGDFWAAYNEERDRYIISLPRWHLYRIPLPEFDRYRIYRHGNYHESLHVAHTPKPLFKGLDVAQPIIKEVVNVLEDRRIEDIGVKQWPGAKSEREHTQAYAYALRPNVAEIWRQGEKLSRSRQVDEREKGEGLKAYARFEAFLQRMLIGKVKGKLPSPWMEKVEEVAQRCEEELRRLTPSEDAKLSEDEISEGVRNLASYVYRELELYTARLEKREGEGRGKEGGERRVDEGDEWTKTFRPDYAKDKDKKKIREDMRKFKGGKGKGSDEVEREWEEIKSGEEPSDPVDSQFLLLPASGDPTPYRNRRFMDRMARALEDWMKRKKMIRGESGTKFSVREYIRSRKEKPFLTPLEKTVAGRKVLMIADFSGSVGDVQEQYKTALVSASEVFDKLGVKTALFGFGGVEGIPEMVFYKVKGFEDPKWTSTHAARVAALRAGGNTPTSSAYLGLEPYIRRHRPDVTVTITDGDPDSVEGTMDAVRRLKRATQMVAFGIEEKPGATKVGEMLQRFGYHKTLSVDDLHELPERLVRLIIPR
ncbi:MAG: vWA domain-containing protein [Candidatus Bathyarchaeia archaeon]